MRLLFLSLLLTSAGASAQETGEIVGRVFEPDGITSVIGVTVRVEGTYLGAQTNVNGDYRILGVPVGTYTVLVSYVGLESQTAADVGVEAGAVRRVNFVLIEPPVECMGLLVCRFTPPLVSNSPFASRIIVGDGIDPPNRRCTCCGCPEQSTIYAGG